MFLLPVLSIPYIFGSLFSNPNLYIFKDILLISIVFIIFLQNKSKLNKISLFFISYLFLINVYGFLKSSDYLFFIISFREMFVFPVLGILLAYYYKLRLEALYYSILITCVFTLLYIPFDYDGSFSSTFRLTSFWDREHETGILGGFLILLSLKNNYKFKLIALLIGGLLVILSFSRSVFLALLLIAIFNIFRKISLFKLFLILSFFALIVVIYTNLGTRALDHNLSARSNQYINALYIIYDSNFLGIGPDKYGVIGNVVKQLCYLEYCTTTMDSTHLKFLVNYGFLYLLLIGFYFFIYYQSRYKEVLFYCFFIGILTGKLSAFPLNLLFYIYLFKDLYTDENSICRKLPKKYRPNKSTSKYS